MGSERDTDLDYDSESVNVADLYDSVVRENPIPPGGKAPAGVVVLVLSALVLVLGGGQLFSTSNGFKSGIFVTDHYRPDPRPSLGGDDSDAVQVAWIEDWMNEGKKTYGNCIACHQASGTGIPGQFPPLVGSEWVDGGTKRLAAILIHGASGPMTVAGQTYNSLMPAWNSLSDEKIAQVSTYVRREFGTLAEGDDGVVTTEMIKAAREEFTGRTQPFTEAELTAIPADEALEGAKVDLQTGEALAN